MNSKKILWIGIYSLIFINALLFNVVLHEIGHYIAANYYNLEPKMEFDFGNMGDLGFGFKGVPVASTSFNISSNESEMIAVILMGPLFNLLLGIVFLGGFVTWRGDSYLKNIMIIGFVISIASFIMNIIPLEGSDGSLLFGFG